MGLVVDMENIYKPGKKRQINGCFGWVDGTLYLGETHHAVMIAEFIKNGTFTWETLVKAKQMWGWFYVCKEYDWATNKYIKKAWEGDITFSTDDAKQSAGVKTLVTTAFKEAFPFVNKWSVPTGKGYTSQVKYGQRAREQYLGEAA